MIDSALFRLGAFSVLGGDPFAGILIDDRVIALSELKSRVMATTMLELLNRWNDCFPALTAVATEVRAGKFDAMDRLARRLDELTIHAPLPEPRTIYCSGANYKKHVIELILAHQDNPATQGMTMDQKRAWGMKLMDERAATGTPFFFIKPQSAVTGPFDSIVIPFEAQKPDWELELAVVIGRRARRVSRQQALDYVAGYTIVNDITLREKIFRRKSDSPELGMDFTPAKGAPTFLPMGPYLTPAAFVGDPQKLHLTLMLNDNIMQDEETADMIFTVAHLIEYLSASVELQPGDVICTGSPAGNGAHYNRFILDGDMLAGTIKNDRVSFGSLRNPCVVEPPM